MISSSNPTIPPTPFLFKERGAVLLHACCAPCEAGVIETLQEHGFKVIVFFYNPNIFPQAEHDKRLAEARRYAEQMRLEYRVSSDGYREYLNAVGQAGNCHKCWELRLQKTAREALSLGVDHFTTTLLASPHQDINYIRDRGEAIAAKHGLVFWYPDPGNKKFKGFRPGFTAGRKLAREHGVYCQTYCGCEASV